MSEREMVRRVKTIIERLAADRTDKLPYCSETTGWQINGFYAGNGQKQLVRTKLREHFDGDAVAHGRYSVQAIGGGTCAVYGDFRIAGRDSPDLFYGFRYEITVIMKNGIAERIMLHGSRDEPVFCMVKSDEDRFYLLKKSEILYIESSHNDLIWHCRDMEVRGRGTLKDLESRLSGPFFRLQRAYIVNADHIRSLGQGELAIDNGDILLVPARRYYEVKKKINKLCTENIEVK